MCYFFLCRFISFIETINIVLNINTTSIINRSVIKMISTDMMKVKTNKIILELTKACKNTMFQKPKHLRSGIFLMHLKLYK